MVDDRVSHVVDRLICNIPAACKVLEEEGFHSLAGQLRRDCEALRWCRERGGLRFERDLPLCTCGMGDGSMPELHAADCAIPKVASEFVRPADSGAEWNLDVEGREAE